jgi:DHA2 family methylenomycin A resistance protein-like MFS transporter
MGSVLHMAPDWRWRLPLAFGLIALAYAGAWALVYRHVRLARPQAPLMAVPEA